MTIRIDEKGNITGIRYVGTGTDIAPFEPVGKPTCVVNAATRREYIVIPGVETMATDACVSYMLGHDKDDNEVLIAFDYLQSAKHRGIIVPSDCWVLTPHLGHLVRRFDNSEEAGVESEKPHTVVPVEVDGWKGVSFHGPDVGELLIHEMLKPHSTLVDARRIPECEPAFGDLYLRDPFLNKKVFGRRAKAGTVYEVAVLKEGPAFLITAYAYSYNERRHTVLQRTIPFDEFCPEFHI